jgi:hypothetical protein
MTTTTERGYSPDSVYAEWSQDERAAADRMEDLFNQGERVALAERVHTQYVRVAPDASLVNLAISYRRQIEDISSGQLTGGPARPRLVRAKLADVEREQQYRTALAQSWLATGGGTHCYSAYVSRGGLEAVARHGAPAPSYQLAMQLDRLNYRRGLPHVLAWGA